MAGTWHFEKTTLFTECASILSLLLKHRGGLLGRQRGSGGGAEEGRRGGGEEGWRGKEGGGGRSGQAGAAFPLSLRFTVRDLAALLVQVPGDGPAHAEPGGWETPGTGFIYAGQFRPGSPPSARPHPRPAREAQAFPNAPQPCTCELATHLWGPTICRSGEPQRALGGALPNPSASFNPQTQRLNCPRTQSGQAALGWCGRRAHLWPPRWSRLPATLLPAAERGLPESQCPAALAARERGGPQGRGPAGSGSACDRHPGQVWQQRPSPTSSTAPTPESPGSRSPVF